MNPIIIRTNSAHNGRKLRQKLLIGTAIAIFANFAAPISAQEEETKEPIDEIIVSAVFEGRTLSDTILGTTVLTESDIQRQMESTIGEMLSRELGMSSTFFGPGASRPIIRGLGGDRVRVLDYGLGSIDASATSPDHAVAIDPALAERVEIMRGSAMLQYGSSAAGGIINVLDGRMPSARPEGGRDGAIRYGFSSVTQGHEIAGATNIATGPDGTRGGIIHFGGFYRSTKDYQIPGFAESQALRDAESDEGTLAPDEEFGVVENTATETMGASGGYSYIMENGHIGFNLKYVDSAYGVPGGHAHEAGEEDERVTIELDQIRFDLRGEIKQEFGPFKAARYAFGYADYEHQEIEDGVIGTRFLNKGWEGRLDFIENYKDMWKGTTGIQIRTRDFSAVGAEAFVPASKMTQIGVFTLKEVEKESWHIDFGGRYELTNYSLNTIGQTASFDSFSASAGIGKDVSRDSFFGVTGFRTERTPSIEELFSDGPHLATSAYERGNRNLGIETALGIEATYNIDADGFEFQINGFMTRYDNFIYEAPTGLVIDDLPVFEFRANDARFRGIEALARMQLTNFTTDYYGEFEVSIDGQIDFVDAKLINIAGNNRLPRIPPLSALIGIEMVAPDIELRGEIEVVDGQDNITSFEMATEGYTLWNSYATFRPFNNKGITIQLKGTNLFNAEARQHTSFLKDIAPLPGRNIRVSLRAEF